MIEDVDLTKKMLQKVADAKSFPANLDADGFRVSIYPDDGNYETNRRKISYHIILAKDNGLIVGGEYQRRPFSGNANYRIAPVDGLTSLGLSYLEYSKSEDIWNKILDSFERESVKVTTKEIIGVLMESGVKLISGSL